MPNVPSLIHRFRAYPTDPLHAWALLAQLLLRSCRNMLTRKLASYLDREGPLTIASSLTNRKCPCGRDRHWSRLLEPYQGHWLRVASGQFHTFILRFAAGGLQRGLQDAIVPVRSQTGSMLRAKRCRRASC